jgi:hypothetical protein
MTAVPIANEAGRRARARARSVQTYARIAGVLFLLSFVAGGFGEAYVPSKLIVSVTLPPQRTASMLLARCSAGASPATS